MALLLLYEEVQSSGVCQVTEAILESGHLITSGLFLSPGSCLWAYNGSREGNCELLRLESWCGAPETAFQLSDRWPGCLGPPLLLYRDQAGPGLVPAGAGLARALGKQQLLGSQWSETWKGLGHSWAGSDSSPSVNCREGDWSGMRLQ